MTSEPSAVLQKVEKLAAAAGIEGDHNLLRQEFVVLFGLPDGRTQEVAVCDSTLEDGSLMISIYSTCLVVDKGLLKGMSKPMAMELLLRNEKLNFARYGVEEDEESYVIVAGYDLLLNESDPEGFKLVLECVALAADDYEAQFDQDIF